MAARAPSRPPTKPPASPPANPTANPAPRPTKLLDRVGGAEHAYEFGGELVEGALVRDRHIGVEHLLPEPRNHDLHPRTDDAALRMRVAPENDASRAPDWDETAAGSADRPGVELTH